jgi:hypothetical protein
MARQDNDYVQCSVFPVGPLDLYAFSPPALCAKLSASASVIVVLTVPAI